MRFNFFAKPVLILPTDQRLKSEAITARHVEVEEMAARMIGPIERPTLQTEGSHTRRSSPGLHHAPRVDHRCICKNLKRFPLRPIFLPLSTYVRPVRDLPSSIGERISKVVLPRSSS